MSEVTCTVDEANAAVDYLRHAFGSWPLPDQDRRAVRRTCLNYTKAEVIEAIDQLVRVADRRPSANDISQRILANRKRKPNPNAGPYIDDPTLTKNLTPSEAIPDLMAAVRRGDQAEIERLTQLHRPMNHTDPQHP